MTELQYDEWSAVAERFGVDLEQVCRDHLISHVLVAIAEGVPTDDARCRGDRERPGSARQRRNLPLADRSARHRPAIRRRTARAAPNPDGRGLRRRQAQRMDGSARALYDLWALSERGLIDADALEVFDSWTARAATHPEQPRRGASQSAGETSSST